MNRLLLALALLAALPARAQGLRVAANGHTLERRDGTPFFWTGDTAWELFHRLNREEAEHYLVTRAAQGFNLIQAVALAEQDGLRVPNADGELPLVDLDPARPNPRYFDHVDAVVRRANALGLTVGFLPTWGDKVAPKLWGAGPEVFNPTNAFAYGEFLGARYRGADLVWILGGDRPAEAEPTRAVWRALAAGLRRGDGGAHLLVYHPSGQQDKNSSALFFPNADPTFDLNGRQDGHGAAPPVFDRVNADFRRDPNKPVLQLEPLYEDHPLSFNAREHGHSLAADARRHWYWSVFGGAAGVTYGHHSVWQMFDSGRAPVNTPLFTWKEALHRPGAGQMRHLRALMEPRAAAGWVPDPGLIVPDDPPTAAPGAGIQRLAACRAPDRSWAMVYAPVGRAFTVRLANLAPARLAAAWFDPRTGKTLPGESFARGESRRFLPPAPGEAQDWVLVLEAAKPAD